MKRGQTKGKETECDECAGHISLRLCLEGTRLKIDEEGNGGSQPEGKRVGTALLYTEYGTRGQRERERRFKYSGRLSVT